MSAFKIRIWCQPKHMSKIRHLRLTSLVSTSCKLFKLFKYCFGTVEDYVMYNEDDAWGSPHRTINTLNTTGINCRFPKVNFLWSYFLLAFKWKYCSYNLYKLFYIVLNGTQVHDTRKIYLYRTLYFYLQVNLWLTEVVKLIIFGKFRGFFSCKKGIKLHLCISM